jgi:very-short-patch-repair endonuclease
VAAADRADSAAERRAVALLRAAGITGWVLGHLLRFTWHELTNRPDHVVAEIRAALAAAESRP